MRNVRKLFAPALCVALISIAAACGSPVAPGPYVLPPPAPPPAPEPARAVLAIEDPSVIMRQSRLSASFDVEIRFLLRETAGKSGATIQNVLVGDERGGGDNTGPSCWVDTIRVAPGAVLDTFYTDEGLKWLSYCAPYGGSISTPVPPYPIIISIAFTDDEGRGGTISARAVVK